MKGRLAVFATAVCICSFLMTPTTPANPDDAPQKPIVVLPASLDGLYPPKAPRPVLFVAMHELNAALTGIVVDITEDDRAGAVANVDILTNRYPEAARLVPEWESLYPKEPVAELARIVPEGDPEQIMAAVAKVGAVCHSCHLQSMVPVQQKYHWPDFAGTTVRDPVTGIEIDYPAFMQMLNAGLTGVAMDLGQGQLDNARGQLAAFGSRMEALRESCDNCHDTERSYFVDTHIENLLAEMRQVLETTVPDAAAVATLSRRIGQESCTGCHLVHMPAAYFQSAQQ